MLLLLLSHFSCVQLCETPQTAAHKAPPSLGFSRQDTRVGCHFLLQCVKVKSLSHARLFTTPWTAAYQAPPSMGFSRQEYWSGVPLPSPSPTESKRLFYTSVSLLLPHTQGYCYHLSKFHIYALVYCIGLFLSGLLHSV